MYMQDDFTVPPPQQRANKRRAGGYVVSNGDDRQSSSPQTAASPLVLRDVNFPMYFTSTNAVSLDSKGSTASFSMRNAPMNIPSNAVDVTAHLAQCSIPAGFSGWTAEDNTITSDETITVSYLLHPYINLGTSTDGTVTLRVTMSDTNTYDYSADLDLGSMDVTELGTIRELVSYVCERLNVAWSGMAHEKRFAHGSDEVFVPYTTLSGQNSDTDKIAYRTTVMFKYPNAGSPIYEDNNSTGLYVTKLEASIDWGTDPPSWGMRGDTMYDLEDVSLVDVYDETVVYADARSTFNIGDTSSGTFLGDGTIDPTHTYDVTYTVPAGNIRSAPELAAVLNALIVSGGQFSEYPLSTELGTYDIFTARQYDDIKKWQLGAYLSSYRSVHSSSPLEVVVSATQASAPGICALLGDSTNDVTITLTTPAQPTDLFMTDDYYYDPVTVYDSTALSRSSSSAYVEANSVCTVKYISIDTNFVTSGMGTDGNISQALAVVPNNASSSSSLISFSQPSPTKVDCSRSMVGDTHNDLILTLKDQDGNGIEFTDTTVPWTICVVVSWKEAIDASRLMISDTLTKFR